jgi:hypothetical protein
MNERKMFFAEVDKGKLGIDFQQLFEKAQELAFTKNGDCKISLVITVKPPKVGNEGYGNVKYKMAITEPSIESVDLFTRLNGCYITRDSENIDGVDQLGLEFDAPKTEKPERVR